MTDWYTGLDDEGGDFAEDYEGSSSAFTYDELANELAEDPNYGKVENVMICIDSY